MPASSHLEDQRHRTWCAVVVLVAVCSLTLSVATRYSAPLAAFSTGVRVVQTHTSPEASRQRLNKDAAKWIPPVVCIGVLQAPTSYPRVAPAAPPIRTLLLEENLYRRPPPSSQFSS